MATRVAAGTSPPRRRRPWLLLLVGTGRRVDDALGQTVGGEGAVLSGASTLPAKGTRYGSVQKIPFFIGTIGAVFTAIAVCSGVAPVVAVVRWRWRWWWWRRRRRWWGGGRHL